MAPSGVASAGRCEAERLAEKVLQAGIFQPFCLATAAPNAAASVRMVNTWAMRCRFTVPLDSLVRLNALPHGRASKNALFLRLADNRQIEITAVVDDQLLDLRQNGFHSFQVQA